MGMKAKKYEISLIIGFIGALLCINTFYWVSFQKADLKRNAQKLKENLTQLEVTFDEKFLVYEIWKGQKKKEFPFEKLALIGTGTQYFSLYFPKTKKIKTKLGEGAYDLDVTKFTSLNEEKDFLYMRDKDLFYFTKGSNLTDEGGSIPLIRVNIQDLKKEIMRGLEGA